MTLQEREIAERVAEGHIHCLIVLEVAGKPAEHVTDSLREYLKLIKEEKHLTVINIQEEEAIALEGENEGFFSAFAEIELLVPNIEGLVSMAMNLTPASIEILAPETFSYSNRQLQNWLNDLLSLLHQVNTTVRGEKQRTAYYVESTERLLHNFISVLLATQPQDAKTLSKLTGVEQDPMDRILAKMHQNGVIAEEEGKWILTSPKK